MGFKHRTGKHGSRCSSRQLGLTLVELLIAVFVLAVVAVLGWRGLDTIVRTREALNEDLAQTRGLQLAFAQMQTDCANIASVTLLPDRLPIDVAPNRLTLVRTTGGDGRPTYLQVISYQVRDGMLTRQESPVTRDLNELQQIWQAALNDFNMRNGVVLHTNVRGMAMRVWDERGWRTGAIAPAAAPLPALPQGRVSRGQFERQAKGGAAATGRPTGLEVALQVQGREATMLKVFLLGVL